MQLFPLLQWPPCGWQSIYFLLKTVLITADNVWVMHVSVLGTGLKCAPVYQCFLYAYWLSAGCEYSQLGNIILKPSRFVVYTVVTVVRGFGMQWLLTVECVLL